MASRMKNIPTKEAIVLDEGLEAYGRGDIPELVNDVTETYTEAGAAIRREGAYVVLAFRLRISIKLLLAVALFSGSAGGLAALKLLTGG